MLLAAAEKGSLSAAARGLNIPIPTLTRKVSELEAQLGTRLLLRTTRKLTLTDAGNAYVAAARQILELVEEQERDAAGEFTAPRGELVVATPVLFGRVHVLPKIVDFLALFPDINVTVLQSDRNIDLVDSRVDVAVRIGRLPDSNLVATRLGAFRVVVCGSPALLAGQGVPRQPGDLASMPTVVFTGPMLSPAWRFRVQDSKESMTVTVKPRFQVSTPDTAAEAAIRGVGVTQLLHCHVAEAVESGKLRLLLEEYEVEPVPVHLVHVSRNLMPLKLRRFIDFVAPQLRESLARFNS